jgi:hypothetical protein
MNSLQINRATTDNPNNNFWLFLFIVSVGLSLFSCKDDLDSCEYEGCDQQRQTIKKAKEVKGRISVFDSQHPNLWVIVSEEGIIGSDAPIFDGPDVVIFCNIPDSLKTNNLRVIFSGELKDSCDDFKPSISEIYYSTITQISSRNDQ